MIVTSATSTMAHSHFKGYRIMPPTDPISTAAALWAKLPSDIARALLLSSDGEARLSRQAARLLDVIGNAPDPDLIATFTDMAIAAWECSPLSARAASVVHHVHSQHHFLREQTAAFSAACAVLRPGNSEWAAEVNNCINSGDIDSAKKHIDQYAAKEPGNLFWLRFASFLGIQLGELDWYEPWLTKFPMPTAFASAFMADYAFARRDWSKAASLYAKAFVRSAMPGWLVREGECHHRQGDRAAARVSWQRALGLRPWQSNLLLRLADLERGSDIPGAPPPGKGEVLLYSWNHGPDLDTCLEALALSHLDACNLTVLDNGSSDNTADVLRAWQERFGERMRTITLPTNVGAPAARNWLLSLETSKAADWVVFLDDDALVPPDWLGFFGTALRQHPEAGIIGCRVVDMAAPLTIQSVDLHFEADEHPGEGDNDPFPRSGARNVVDTHMTVPDFGQYSYLRPAVSVTGCCHLLTRKNIDDIGLFDLRFSPSQFDDFERDLRSCDKGQFCLYQGHLCVRHIKRSGVIAGMSPWQKANVTGNLAKLWASYSQEQVEAITKKEIAGLLKDIGRRLEVL